jgi:hypothetical protein
MHDKIAASPSEDVYSEDVYIYMPKYTQGRKESIHLTKHA